jgi:RNA polymerase sigma factor (sigma-70 family)
VNAHDSNATGPVGPLLLGRLLDEHAAALELYARQFCRCPEDVVQEALIELVRQPAAPREIVAWLYRVVRNKALSASRSADRRQRREAAVAAERAEWFVPADDAPVNTRAVSDALESLPTDQREVVVAHVWGGLTFEEIGQLTGVSDSAAHRRYTAALSALRGRLKLPCVKKT